jgi:alpha-glucosidase
VKTGYAGAIRPEGQSHHGQYMVNHYRKVMETAAKYEIMLDVHEPVKFTGLERTYPNLMTGEGVRGMEWNAWSEGNPPEHTVIIPFTRMLAGPVDYTPGIFDITYKNVKDVRIKWNGNDKGNSRVNSTLANQLALYVILYSPWQMTADLPENYKNHPAFEFIRKVPVNWDDTKVLNAEIGEFVTIARKNGDSWYIGSITNEDPRDIEIELSFLDEGRKYRAVIYSDDESTDLYENPTAFKIDTISVTGKSTHRIVLAGGGGQAVILESVD